MLCSNCQVFHKPTKTAPSLLITCCNNELIFEGAFLKTLMDGWPQQIFNESSKKNFFWWNWVMENCKKNWRGLQIRFFRREKKCCISGCTVWSEGFLYKVAKNFTNYVFCQPQLSGVIQNIENRCTILTSVCLCQLLSK